MGLVGFPPPLAGSQGCQRSGSSLPLQGFLVASGGMGARPCVPHDTQHQSQLPALSHAHWSFPKHTPRSTPTIPRGRLSPHPCPPQPQPLQAAKPNSCCLLLAEAAPPAPPEAAPRQRPARAGGDHDAPRCVPRFPAWGRPSRCPPADPSSPSTWGPPLPPSPGSPSKLFLRLEELAKATGPAGNRLYSRQEKGDDRTPLPPPFPQTLPEISGGG